MAENKGQKINITVGKTTPAQGITNQPVVRPQNKMVKAEAIPSQPADDFYSSKLGATPPSRPTPVISQPKTSKPAAASANLDSSSNVVASPPRPQRTEAAMITPPTKDPNAPTLADQAAEHVPGSSVPPNTTILPGDYTPAPTPAESPLPTSTPQALPTHRHQPENPDSLPTSSKFSRKGLLGLAAIILVLLLGGGGWAYAYLYQPRQAVASYLERLTEIKQGRFETEFDIKDESANFDGRLSGVFDNRDPQTPRLQAEADINTGISGVNLNIDGELRLVGQTLYAQPGDSLFWQFLLGSTEPSWYRLDLDDSQELTKESCSEADIVAVQNYFEQEVTRVLQINNPGRSSLFGEDYDGRRVQRYSGEITGRSLATMRQELVGRLSPECIRNDAGQPDLENMSIIYTLRTAEQFDRLELVLRDGTQAIGTINLTTEDYNKSVEITTPPAARPIEELFDDDPEGGFDGGNLFAPEALGPEPASMLR